MINDKKKMGKRFFEKDQMMQTTRSKKKINILRVEFDVHHRFGCGINKYFRISNVYIFNNLYYINGIQEPSEYYIYKRYYKYKD